MASLEILELLCGEIELNHLEFGPLLSKMVGDGGRCQDIDDINFTTDAADSSILSPTFTRRFLTWCDAGLQQCDDESGEKSEGKSLDDKGDANSIADKCDANSLQMIGSLCLGNQAKSRKCKSTRPHLLVVLLCRRIVHAAARMRRLFLFRANVVESIGWRRGELNIECKFDACRLGSVEKCLNSL